MEPITYPQRSPCYVNNATNFAIFLGPVLGRLSVLGWGLQFHGNKPGICTAPSHPPLLGLDLASPEISQVVPSEKLILYGRTKTSSYGRTMKMLGLL